MSQVPAPRCDELPQLPSVDTVGLETARVLASVDALLAGVGAAHVSHANFGASVTPGSILQPPLRWTISNERSVAPVPSASRYSAVTHISSRSIACGTTPVIRESRSTQRSERECVHEGTSVLIQTERSAGGYPTDDQCWCGAATRRLAVRVSCIQTEPMRVSSVGTDPVATCSVGCSTMISGETWRTTDVAELLQRTLSASDSRSDRLWGDSLQSLDAMAKRLTRVQEEFSLAKVTLLSAVASGRARVASLTRTNEELRRDLMHALDRVKVLEETVSRWESAAVHSIADSPPLASPPPDSQKSVRLPSSSTQGTATPPPPEWVGIMMQLLHAEHRPREGDGPRYRRSTARRGQEHPSSRSRIPGKRSTRETHMDFAPEGVDEASESHASSVAATSSTEEWSDIDGQGRLARTARATNADLSNEVRRSRSKKPLPPTSTQEANKAPPSTPIYDSVRSGRERGSTAGMTASSSLSPAPHIPLTPSTTPSGRHPSESVPSMGNTASSSSVGVSPTTIRELSYLLQECDRVLGSRDD